MAKTIKIKSKTLRQRNALIVTNVVMYGSKYAMPFVPATVMTIINWDEWFAQTNGGLPAGFLALVVATVISILGILKRDKLAEKHISTIIPFALALFVVAASFLWLSNVMHQAGMMFLYTACAVAVSAIDDQVQQSVVKPALIEIEEDIKDAGMSKKENKRQERKKERLAEMEEARKRAIE